MMLKKLPFIVLGIISICTLAERALAYQPGSRESIIASELDKFDRHHQPLETPSYSAAEKDSFDFSYTAPASQTAKAQNQNTTVTGEAKMGLGITPRDTLWKQANYDLNERNFRLLSDDQLNNQENTFDPGVFSRLKFDVDAKNVLSDLHFHSQISIDPWSFTAKTDKITVAGAGGDRIEIEAKYWANTGYTINEIFNTLDNGDSIAFPELKARDQKLPGFTATSNFSNTFTFSEMKLHRSFQPFREMWFELSPDENHSLVVFPLALQDKALTSDDPLHISNNHIYWEESPWLASWKPGNLNSNAGDFTKGEWDDSLAFFTRDSDGTRLTALRGFSFSTKPSDTTSIETVVATPKTLWQEYDSYDAIPSSIRLKIFPSENVYVGSTLNGHFGFADSHLDAYNAVGGLDSGLTVLNDALQLQAQVTNSQTKQDLTNDTYETKKRGLAYYFALSHAYGGNGLTPDKDFNALKPISEKEWFYKMRLYFARMDDGFESSLANYRETRDDSYWSRHLNFAPPVHPFFTQYGYGSDWYDVEPFAIGNGIDIGRNVVGFNTDTNLFEGRLQFKQDIRNVHLTNNKFIENVSRSELTHKTTDKLTTRLLYLNHTLPNTKGGVDPFVFDSDTGEFFLNTAIPDGEDPSLETGSAGLLYDINQWLAVNGAWEYTNDFTAGTDNFPRGVLNSSSFTTFMEDGLTFRKELPFLYSQGAFDLPPYEFHHVFKSGLLIKPKDNLQIYFDYTRNPNEFAGQIDNHINHAGVEVSYVPLQKLGMFFKYTWSRWNDLNEIVNNSKIVFESHHNVFTELRYNPSQTDNLTLQYGVGPSPTLATPTFNPFGGSLLTLDTQHIFRLFYQKMF